MTNLHDRRGNIKARISVKESDPRWCADGFEFGCDDDEKLRVTFALDCCDLESIDWAASTGGYGKATVQDVMSGAIEKRFGDRPGWPIQWLTDNGSAYTTHETRQFARELNLELCTTAVSSPQSNGMRERFVKTMKSDYISIIPKPDVLTAVKTLRRRSNTITNSILMVPWLSLTEGISTSLGNVNLSSTAVWI